MSSIRIRLSRMWNNSDGENTSPAESRKPSTTNSLALTQDSGFWSMGSLRLRSNTSSSGLCTSTADRAVNIDARDSTYNGQRSVSRFSSSTRSIHDVASSTFRFVSDALRSKTNLFYVESARSVTPFLVESNTSSKHQQKSRILSSLRSRRSHSDKLNRPVVASYVHVPEIPHELHVDIPDHTLLQTGSNESDEALLGTLSSSDAFQTSDFLPQRIIAKQPVVFKESLDESEAETCVSASEYTTQRSSEKAGSELQSTDASYSHKGRDLSEPESLHDTNHTTETAIREGRYSRDVLQTSSYFSSLASKACKPTRKLRVSGNLFVKGNREQTRRIGTPSPYRRALRNSESYEALPMQPNDAFGLADRLNTSKENSILSRLSISRATSFTRGLSNLVMTDGENGEVGGKLVVDGELSECYDGDAESCDEVPTMSPRTPWNKARADPLKRYQLVRTMSAGTESNTSEDSGLRLRPSKEISKSRANSPIDVPDGDRKVHPVTRGDNGQNTNLRERQPRQATQSAPIECPRARDDVLVVEANDKHTGGDVWYAANESLVESGRPAPAIENSSYSLSNDYSCGRSFSNTSVAYGVEAIERRDGITVYSSEEASEDDPESSTQKTCPKKNAQRLPQISPNNLQIGAAESSRPLSAKKVSSYSISTSDSCAITTSIPLCYRDTSIPSVHVHTTPVRRTSNINDEVHQGRDEAEGRDSFIVHSRIAESVSETVWSIEVQPPSPSSNMFPVGSEQTAFITNTNEVDRSINDFKEGNEEHGRSSECLLERLKLDDNEPLTEAETSTMVVETNNRDSSRTSSMSAPSTDFAQVDVQGSQEDGLDSESTLGSVRGFCPMVENHKLSSIIGDIVPSYESEDMNIWLAEHPGADSLAESDVELASYENDSDFFPTNPELDHYLDQDFSKIPCSGANAERSDDDNDGFLTSLATPSRCAQRAKQFSSSLRMHLSEMDKIYCRKMEPVYCVVTTRPPVLATKSSGKASSPSGSTDLFDDEETLLRNITPTAIGSRKNRKISWQMRDNSYGGEDFTYEAVGSQKQVLQSSSSQKGVWWGGELESEQSTGSPLRARPDGDLSSHECDTEEEVRRHIHSLPYRIKSGLDNNLLALLATANIRNRDGSFTTATSIADSIDGNEDLADVYSLEASCNANESATPTKEDCTTEALEDTEVRDIHLLLPAVGTLTELNLEQGQDANKLGDFFTTPIYHDQRLQAHGQEVQTAVEPYQGETLVSDDEEDFRVVVGAWPRAVEHARVHVLEDSWYSFN